LHLNNLYQSTRFQLANTQQQLQQYAEQCQTERQYIKTELDSTLQRLHEERDASEVVNQDFSTLEDCHLKLQEEHKRIVAHNYHLEESVKTSNEYAKEVSVKAESLINHHLQTEGRGGEAAEGRKGQSLSAMILESAKNSLLVNAMSRQFPEEHINNQLKYVMDNNVQFQLRITELEQQNKVMSQQLENANNENANLKKAAELVSEDQQQQKPRRGRKAKPVPSE
jgi:hypothetical protein